MTKKPTHINPNFVRMEIVRTRCTDCGYECYCLVSPLARGQKAPDFLHSWRCGKELVTGFHVRACAGALRVVSARGLAFRWVKIGEGPRWNVAAPGMIGDDNK